MGNLLVILQKIVFFYYMIDMLRLFQKRSFVLSGEHENQNIATHDGARLPPKWAVSAWVTFFQDGGFKRAKACGYIGEEILGLAG